MNTLYVLGGNVLNRFPTQRPLDVERPKIAVVSGSFCPVALSGKKLGKRLIKRPAAGVRFSQCPALGQNVDPKRDIPADLIDRGPRFAQRQGSHPAKSDTR